MSLKQLLYILRARWLLSLGILLGTVALALIVSWVLPKQYTATASVVIDVKSPDPIAGMVLPGMMAPGYMATQLDIIQSERVARRVVQMLHLDQAPALREQWQDSTGGTGSFEAWVARLIGKNLDVKPSRESNVVQLTYKAAEPAFASAVVNAFVRAYIDTTIDLRTQPAREYGTIFDNQAKALREKLEVAQGRLTAYQKETGLTSVDERLDVETARLNELSTQLVIAQSATAESRGRQAKVGANSAEVLNNAVVAGLNADLSRQQARLKELGARLGSAHPQVQELSANIEELKARIAAEVGKVAGSVTINNSVNTSRESEIKAALDRQRQKILQLNQQRDQANVLRRDVDSAQRAYEAIQTRISQTSLESQSTQTNVSVLESATPPTESSSPKVILNTLAAVFLGTLAGLGVSVGLEFLDRRVRTEEDITIGSGHTLLGVMPKGSANGKHSSPVDKKPRQLGRRPLSELTGPAI